MAATVARDDDRNDLGKLTAHVGELDGIVVVSIAGELDMATVQEAGSALEDAITPGKPVVIDMTGLTFFSSAGLTLLARLHEKRRQSPLDVHLVADQRVVILPMRLSGLHDLFPLHNTLDGALRQISEAG